MIELLQVWSIVQHYITPNHRVHVTHFLKYFSYLFHFITLHSFSLYYSSFSFLSYPISRSFLGALILFSRCKDRAIFVDFIWFWPIVCENSPFYDLYQEIRAICKKVQDYVWRGDKIYEKASKIIVLEAYVYRKDLHSFTRMFIG